MIRDPASWSEWESRGPLSEPVDFQRNLRLMEAMYEWACKLGVLPYADPLAGLEDKIRLVRLLNHVRGSAEADRSGA